MSFALMVALAWAAYLLGYRRGSLLAEGHAVLASEISAALAGLGAPGGGLAVVDVVDDGRGNLTVSE